MNQEKGDIVPAVPETDRSQEIHVPSDAVLPLPYRTQVTRPRMRDDDFVVSPALLFQAFFQCWKVALPLALLLGALSTAAILHFFVPRYRASAWIQINDHTPYLAYETPESEFQAERYVQTQIELLRGPLVLSSVLSMPQIAALSEFAENQNPVDWLSHQIDVSPVGQSQLYQVSYVGPTPDGAALIVNAVVDQYFDLTDQNESARTHRIVDLLEEEKARRQVDVEKLKERMQSLRQEIVGTDAFGAAASPETGLMMRSIDLLRSRLTEAEVDAKVRAAELQAQNELMARRTTTIPDSVVDMEARDDPQIRALYSEYADLREMLRRTAQASAHGQDDPSYLRLNEEAQRLQADITEVLERKRAMVRENLLMEAELKREEELTRLRVAADTAASIYDDLQKEYDARVEELKNSDDKSLELELTQSELAREEKVFDMIAERVTSLRTEMRAPGRVSLWQRATAPAGPIERLPMNQILIAWFACFTFPFGIGILREVVSRKIRSRDQMEHTMPVRFVSEVARLPYRAPFLGRRTMLLRNKKTSLFEESVDALRTSLMLSENLPQSAVLAIVSATHKEGKTSVSTQLAVSLARSSGRPTLLIDGDMRAPSLHNIFRVSLGDGLANVLDNHCSCTEAVVCGVTENLDFLPAGRIHKSPHVLTGNNAVYDLIETFRGLYDFIVIDTPPILSASEGLVLAKAADEVVFCAMSGHSRENQVELAYKRLMMAGVRVAGAVLSGVPAQHYAYNYGTYYQKK
jgi:capsular exopolysaccharide synthesis family protein